MIETRRFRATSFRMSLHSLKTRRNDGVKNMAERGCLSTGVCLALFCRRSDLAHCEARLVHTSDTTQAPRQSHVV